jgi:hypothetical protein
MDYEKMIKKRREALNCAVSDLENERMWYYETVNTKGKARANLNIADKKAVVERAKENLAAIQKEAADTTLTPIVMGTRHLTLKSGKVNLATIQINLSTGKIRFLNINSEVSMINKGITFKNLPENELTIEL